MDEKNLLVMQMKTYATSEVVDACIVGAGIGGIMARLLAEAGLSVVVLEAGPHWNPIRDFVNDQDLMAKKFAWNMPITYAGEKGGRRVDPSTIYGVGGRMNHWGAVNVRLRPSTFLAGSMEGFGDDWPVTYEELVPYYQKAERDLGVSGDHTAYPVPREPFPLPAHPITYADQVVKKGFDTLGLKAFPLPRGIVSQPYRGRPACNYCGFCLWGCPINSKANPVVTHVPQAMAAGAEIRAKCYAREVTVDSQGRANGVIYFDPDGREHQQKARMVLLSCSSPHTARLLLNSKSKLFPQGLANNNGQVGRNVTSTGASTRVWGIYERPLDGYRGFGTLTSHDFFVSDAKRGFVGGYMIITASPSDVMLERMIYDATSAWGAELKGLMKDFYRHVFCVLGHAYGIVNEKNRVDLDPEAKDEWEIPLARLTVYRTPNDEAMAAHQLKTCTDIPQAGGALKTFVTGARERMISGSSDIGGTKGGDCRMGKDPRRSVVNPFCQSHEVKNLFILDASVVVNATPCENTLTLIALTYRAGEFILNNRRDIFAA